MPRSKGYRRKTRSLLTKDRKVDSGLSSIIREYKVNDRVVIKINPSVVKGMPHRRYQGKVGVVEKVFRRALLVNIKDGGKTKKVIARMEHVKPFKL
ncbi:MAG: 50S ribosomal protein L21e [Nitrososphaeria archaeon]